MSEMKEKYPWWDWSFFIQMQLDWLKEASEKHKEEGHLQNHVEVSGELEAAYMFLREAKEAFDGTTFR